MVEECKLRVGNIRRSGKLIYKDNRIYFNFGFWKGLNHEIKKMEGRKYHGYDKVNPKKWWSAPDTLRNRFAIAFLKEENPYAPYDTPLLEVRPERSLYMHQITMVRHAITRKQCILACEMGVGKTLAAIEVIEYALKEEVCDTKIIKHPYWGHHYVWYVGPKSALMAVKHEFKKWEARIQPLFMTYDRLVRVMKDWEDEKAPKVVIFDESSKIKTPTAQRSQAALGLANGVRDDWGNKGYILEMSGSPAPKSPADWWHQCEVACPGFIAEGNIHIFRERLAVIDQRENPITGGQYPYLIGWRDGVICGKCGEKEFHDIHQNQMLETYHTYVPSENELDKLYKRMQGLVLVQFKKDCLDLPEKQYRLIEITPEPDTIRTAKAIAQVASTAIKALTLLRELSDGFQYIEVEVGRESCPSCFGNGEIIDFENPTVQVRCPKCNGRGDVPILVRQTKEVSCPKDDVVKQLLDEHDDVGRFIIYAAFTGAIDRIVKLCRTQHWAVIRVDGRGWHWFGDTEENGDLIDVFQNQLVKYPRVVFVGHPGSAGMGLTLTASPSIYYYSNSFKAEDRIQSEDRIHRPGLDENRGATIIDAVHLPTDQYVLDNVKAKRDMQSVTLGEIRVALAGK